eukprot:2866929-Prymnesium_polylepis.1
MGGLRWVRHRRGPRHRLPLARAQRDRPAVDVLVAAGTGRHSAVAGCSGCGRVFASGHTVRPLYACDACTALCTPATPVPPS